MFKKRKKRSPATQETRLKMRIAHLGLKHTPESIEKIRQALKGNKSHTGHIFSLQVRKNMSNGQKGEKGSNWRGGLNPKNKGIRSSFQYKEWRKAVFERDGYRCVIGGNAHGSYVQADHIKRFSEYPELRFDVDNGRTLCVPCHRKTDTYGPKRKVLQQRSPQS